MRLRFADVAQNTLQQINIPNRAGYNVVADGDMPIVITGTIRRSVLEFDTANARWSYAPTARHIAVAFMNFGAPAVIPTTTLNAWVLMAPGTVVQAQSSAYFGSSAGANRITCTFPNGTSTVRVKAEICGSFQSNNRAGAFRFHKNGATITASESRRVFGNAGVYDSVNLEYIATGCVANDYFEVYMSNVSNNSAFDCTKLRITCELLETTA